MAKRQYGEHQEQKALVDWFRLQYPRVRIFAIPNGGHRNVVVAAKLKAEGVSAGVPDLYIPEWRLWVEMKTAKGRLTPSQKDWIDYLSGFDTVIVAYGFEDAVEKITTFKHH